MISLVQKLKVQNAFNLTKQSPSSDNFSIDNLDGQSGSPHLTLEAPGESKTQLKSGDCETIHLKEQKWVPEQGAESGTEQDVEEEQHAQLCAVI